MRFSVARKHGPCRAVAWRADCLFGFTATRLPLFARGPARPEFFAPLPPPRPGPRRGNSRLLFFGGPTGDDGLAPALLTPRPVGDRRSPPPPEDSGPTRNALRRFEGEPP